MKKLKLLFISVLVTMTVSLSAQTHIDKAFLQDYADKYELTEKTKSAEMLLVRTDRNKLINIHSSEGLMQPWEKSISKNNIYRPFEDMKIVSMDIFDNQFIYLTDIAVLSNSWAGKFYISHGLENPAKFLVIDNFATLIAAEGELALFQEAKKVWGKSVKNLSPIKLIYDESASRFLILSTNAVYQLKYPENKLSKVYSRDNLTAMTLHDNKIILGTNDGILKLDAASFKASEIDNKLPYTNITVLENIDGQLWFGSTNGAFKLREDGKYDYYASKRWLVDNNVVDIAKGPDKSVVILSKEGLSKINFIEITLAEKAEYFQEIQRLRHIRYGLTASLTLKIPGDLTTGTLHDTDNDGLWTSLYLAGELFRYAVTKSEDAKLNAYEAFEAMEQLTNISGVSGFPARAYERDGVSLHEGSNGFSEEQMIAWQKENGASWQFDETGRWKWKVSTSSDESCGHFFVYALFADLAPDQEWRDRAIRQIKLQMDHIIENNWRLVTWNGKPTRWGNWTPEYVNSFPINVGDRRLNSTNILAFLQTAYHFTGDELYKEKAYELINDHGYDENANRPATVIAHVPGEPLSTGWNHSDDEMYFLTVPAFVNYSFTEEQKQKHFEAIKSHWEIERSEKNPLWNFIYALSGGTEIDLEESIWWLQEYPMDLIKWSVDNSLRNDVERIEANFRNQEYKEGLPPDERPVHLHNGAYRNNSGGAGRSENAPYVWLLPYWAGRYIDAISAPVEK